MSQPNSEPKMRYFWRFDLLHRIMHGFLIYSFLGLGATGLPIRFSNARLASTIADGMGGFGTIIFLHKLFAVILTVVFLIHVGYLARRLFINHEFSILWGPTTLVPQPRDLFDIINHFRWFFGLGPRPRFDRYTYWEKFDYWAVFWGMAVIGSSGYMMWASGFFGQYLPGWLFNIALLIHSDEALLAVCFIIAIHFFNSHLRPEKFPMDLVIFTGRVSEEELEEERPDEYERLLREKGLDAIETDRAPLWLRNYGRVLGATAVSIGIVIFIFVMLAL